MKLFRGVMSEENQEEIGERRKSENTENMGIEFDSAPVLRIVLELC